MVAVEEKIEILNNGGFFPPQSNTCLLNVTAVIVTVVDKTANMDHPGKLYYAYNHYHPQNKVIGNSVFDCVCSSVALKKKTLYPSQLGQDFRWPPLCSSLNLTANLQTFTHQIK